MNIVLFEDGQVLNLNPVTLGRPAFTIGCGGTCLAELATASGNDVYGVTRPYVAHLAESLYGLRRIDALPADEPCLWINARAVPTRALGQVIDSFASSNHEATAKLIDDQVVLAFFHKGGNRSEFVRDADAMATIGFENVRTLDRFREDIPLFNYPHEIVCQHVARLQDNLIWRLAFGRFDEVQDGVFLGEDVKLNQPIVFDTSLGPIVIESETTVGPFSLLQGPLYIGPEVTIAEHSSLRGGVSVGRSSKVGGEIHATTIEAYSNKRHYGYLGHSYVGSWVNLGAGTSNSDLKNTYGEIRMTYRDEKVATGTQFLGCILGDYVKTAINTSIFTGKLIGAFSMLYGLVASNVPSFVNYGHSLGQVTEIPAAVAATTQRRAFERRRIEQCDVDIRLIQAVFELTQCERKSAAFAVLQGLPAF